MGAELSVKYKNDPKKYIDIVSKDEKCPKFLKKSIRSSCTNVNTIGDMRACFAVYHTYINFRLEEINKVLKKNQQ